MMRWCYILSLLLMTGFVAKTQTTIQLIVKGDKIKTIDVFDLSQKEIQDFSYNDTVTASFSKKNIDCYNIIYRAENKNFSRQIWLDTGRIVIHGHIDASELVIDTVINSPIYYAVKEFYKNYFAYNRQRDTSRINDFLVDEIRRYSGSPLYIPIASFYVDLNLGSPSKLSILKNITDSLPDKFEWFILYMNVIGRMEKILAGTTVNTSNYSFTNIKGKQDKMLLEGADYYVLDFWFLNCKPCLEDHVDINKEYAVLKKNKMELISISTDRDSEKWTAYLKKHQYKWPNYLQDAEVNITEDLSIAIFPTYIVLDKTGKLLAMYNSFEDVKSRFLLNR